jgi:hypothetical protein
MKLNENMHCFNKELIHVVSDLEILTLVYGFIKSNLATFTSSSGFCVLEKVNMD